MAAINTGIMSAPGDASLASPRDPSFVGSGSPEDSFVGFNRAFSGDGGDEMNEAQARAAAESMTAHEICHSGLVDEEGWADMTAERVPPRL